MKRSKIEKEFVNKLVEMAKTDEHKKYGKLILQTNEVHWYLGMIIVVRSGAPDDDYQDYVYTGAELGMLINLFNASSKGLLVAGHLISELKKYNRQRNRLAHKMFSTKKLTLTECEKTIQEGEKIVEMLKVVLKEQIGDLEKKNK